MIKPLLLSGIFFLFGHYLKSQSIERELVSSSGNELTNDQVNLNFSIGEIVVNTIQFNENYSTPGFHQSDLLTTSFKNSFKSDVKVDVFPNPFTDFIIVNIKDSDLKRAEFKLINIEGKILKTGVLTSDKNKIILSNYKLSVYFLSILDHNGSIIKTFKLNASND